MATKAKQQTVVISAPKFETISLRIVGTAPYMQARFSKKLELMAKMSVGSQAKSKRTRVARDFDKDFVDAQYFSDEGWNGINASSFRNACISACRVVGFKMTLAKLSIFVEADGYDKHEGLPLVRIYGKPERVDMATRNATGVADVRSRPMWKKWHCDLRIRYDADQFSASDVVNLLSRAGMQVGIGEGRPDSKSSAGLGLGLFRVEESA